MATQDKSRQQATQIGFCVYSEAMRKFVAMVERVAGHAANVLIVGETGSGKERVAQTIHQHSLRSEQPFIDINCAALPEHLVESEFFGYEKGAFSGADTAKPGLFELANTGTIFLDEIGELDIKAQAKLLRVLDRAPYYRLGGHHKITADVRVVAATNRDLKEEVKAGRFRKDLYHRISQFELSVPPLRDRPEDIVVLAELFLTQFDDTLRFSPDALRALQDYSWPGNVRELQNVVNKVAFIATGTEIGIREVRLELSNGPQDEGQADTRLESLKSRAIQKALEETGGHQGLAAEKLGISRRTLSRKVRELGLTRVRALATASPSDGGRQRFRAAIRVLASLLTLEGHEVLGMTTDISATGVGLEGLTTRLGYDRDLRVRFQLTDAARPIEMMARLAWVDKQGGAGIIFTDVNPAVRRELDRWLYERMAEQGRSIDAGPSDLMEARFTPASSYKN
jgi:DNA-binding NtrC family response regulator